MQRCITLATILVLTVPVSAQTFLGRNTVTWTQDLERTDEAARRNAAYALGKLGGQAAPSIPNLVKRLKEDKSAKVREAAAAALGEIGLDARNPSASQLMIPALTLALKDDNHLVRRSAAYALGNLGADAAPSKAALAAALNDDRPEVRQNVAWALGKLGAMALPDIRKALADADTLVKRDAAAALAPLDPNTARQALNDLLPLCRERNSEVRKAALNVLIKIVGPQDTGAIASIREALLDPDPETRATAALALSNIGGKATGAAVPVLVEALRRGDVELRRQAAAALRNIGPEARDAVSDLVKALSDGDDETRRHAALALGGIGPDAEPAVAALVNLVANRQETMETRSEAAMALKNIGAVPAAVRALPALLKVVEDAGDDGKVRALVMWPVRVHNPGLRSMPNVFETFTKVVSEPRTEKAKLVRYDCARMLAVLQGPRVITPALDVLLECLKDDGIGIFIKQESNVGGTGQESGPGKANVEIVLKGDGRMMAIEALSEVGPTRVNQRRDIVQQVQALANNAKNAELRQACKKLLKDLR